MGQSPYFASPTPRSFRKVFNIVSNAVSQSISPPPAVAAGGFFDSAPGFVEDRSPNDWGFSKESGDSLSGGWVAGVSWAWVQVEKFRGGAGSAVDWWILMVGSIWSGGAEWILLQRSR